MDLVFWAPSALLKADNTLQRILAPVRSQNIQPNSVGCEVGEGRGYDLTPGMRVWWPVAFSHPEKSPHQSSHPVHDAQGHMGDPESPIEGSTIVCDKHA